MKGTPDPEPWRRRIADELWGSVVPFWLEHSLDHEYGGYLNQLDRDGSCFGHDKHVWHQGRPGWTFSKLFLERGEER